MTTPTTTYMTIEALRTEGFKVEEQDIPGLYRVNDGPEVTRGQLIGMCIDVLARKS